MINYTLVGFTMGYGQMNPHTYHYMVDDRLCIKDVRNYLEDWFSWMKVLKVTKIPFDNRIKPNKTGRGDGMEIVIDGNKYYIWGFFTRKE